MNWSELINAKNFTELVSDGRVKLAANGSKITNWSVGGVARTLVEVSCYCLAQLYSLLVSVVPMGFIDYAAGNWLELKVAEVGISRKAAKKVIGQVVFSRSTDMNRAVSINSGSIVKTEMQNNGQELRFFTTADVILESGAASIKVPVIAEFAGAAWNVGEGYIRVLVTHIAGIDAVTNEASWITEEGVDVETDKALRERYKLKWNELATGSTALAYKSWAYQVEGVMDVSINDSFPRGPGTVDVIIAGPNGTPTEALKTAVKAYVDTRRPACSDVQVLAPIIKTVNVDITMYVYPDKGVLADVKTAAEAVLQDFFVSDTASGIEAQHIGDDFIKSRLIKYLMAIDNVFNVVINSPAADISIGTGELAGRGTVQISAERVLET